MRWAATTSRLWTFLHKTTINLLFFALVCFSFYLCLSSLLSIPLMKTNVVAQGFAVDDLDKAFLTEIPTREDHDNRYPPIGANFDFTGIPFQVETTLSVISTNLTQKWDIVRSTAYGEYNNLRKSAVESFRSQNAQRLGGRETVGHYNALLIWYRAQKRSTESRLLDCQNGARVAVRTSHGYLDRVRRPDTETTERDLTNVVGQFEFAISRCDDALNGRFDPVPLRPSRSASLNTVGNWVDWLLSTESMPLVIIVGLVGFSVLGATISRFVRVGETQGLSDLSMSDLLVVVAAGATSAMVVFLASYGGLAIVGEQQIDPNPYVIFAMVLVGAIFSEDVWRWARVKILGSITNAEQDRGG